MRGLSFNILFKADESFMYKTVQSRVLAKWHEHCNSLNLKENFDYYSRGTSEETDVKIFRVGCQFVGNNDPVLQHIDVTPKKVEAPKLSKALPLPRTALPHPPPQAWILKDGNAIVRFESLKLFNVACGYLGVWSFLSWFSSRSSYGNI